MKIAQWEPKCSMRTDEQMKLPVAFWNYANALESQFVKLKVHTGRNMRVTAFWDHAMNWTIQVRFSAGKRLFLFFKTSRLALEPPSLIFNAYWGFRSLELKRPRREFDHLYPVRRFRNTKSYTSIHLTFLHDVYFTFLPLRSSGM